MREKPIDIIQALENILIKAKAGILLDQNEFECLTQKEKEEYLKLRSKLNA